MPRERTLVKKRPGEDGGAVTYGAVLVGEAGREELWGDLKVEERDLIWFLRASEPTVS